MDFVCSAVRMKTGDCSLITLIFWQKMNFDYHRYPIKVRDAVDTHLDGSHCASGR